jgi:hypothetical protein
MFEIVRLFDRGPHIFAERNILKWRGSRLKRFKLDYLAAAQAH